MLWATSHVRHAEPSTKPVAWPRRRGAERFYSRYGNPTVNGFEDAVAELEGAEAALAFASGMGAVSASCSALCSTGDHIVAQRQLYAGHPAASCRARARASASTSRSSTAPSPARSPPPCVPGRRCSSSPRRPANPQLALVDLDELGAIAGPITVVDSTFATPIVQQPLDHGVDLVLHSATKGIAGHNDATLGVVAGAKDLLDSIWAYAVLHGAVRLAVRRDERAARHPHAAGAVRAPERDGAAPRRVLESHPAVSYVRYPGLDSHPQRELAKRQMALGRSMLAFDLAGGLEAGRRFVEGVQLAQLASSLGGPETLVTHPASTTHVGLTPDERLERGIDHGLVRVSVGLEHPDDLVADFAQALAALA